MEDLESLLFGLLFLAIVGFQVFKQFLAARAEMRRRMEQAQARAGLPQSQAGYELEPVPEPVPEPLDLAGTDWGRVPVPPPVVELPVEVQQALRHPPVRQRDDAPVSAAAVAAAARRAAAKLAPPRARHHLFHSRRALRHGIVMMTVLGPCRAVQPYDRSDL